MGINRHGRALNSSRFRMSAARLAASARRNDVLDPAAIALGPALGVVPVAPGALATGLVQITCADRPDPQLLPPGISEPDRLRRVVGVIQAHRRVQDRGKVLNGEAAAPAKLGKLTVRRVGVAGFVDQERELFGRRSRTEEAHRLTHPLTGKTLVALRCRLGLPRGRPFRKGGTLAHIGLTLLPTDFRMGVAAHVGNSHPGLDRVSRGR